MKRLIVFTDRWGMVLLIYILPWQARIIFSEGLLAGAPSEALTRSIFAVECLIVALLIVRFLRLKLNRSSYFLLPTSYSLTFVALALLTLCSILISADRGATLAASIQLALGGALLFLIITAPSAREVRIAFVVSMCVQSAIAVSQLVFQRIYPSTLLGMSAHYPELAGTSVVESGGLRLLRAYGTFPHPNILGGGIAIALLIARSLFRRFSVYATFTYILLTIGLFLTFSRLAWVALIIGLCVSEVVAARKRALFEHSSRPRRDAVASSRASTTTTSRYSLGLCATVGLTFLFCAILFAPFVIARVGASGRLETKSLVTRVTSFRDATALIQNHPLTGVGAGAFTVALLREVDQNRSGYALQPVHSVPLLIFSEIGLFGFALFVLLIYYLARQAINAHNLGLVATLIILALFDHWAWSTFAGILLFWAGWGMALKVSTPPVYKSEGGD